MQEGARHAMSSANDRVVAAPGWRLMARDFESESELEAVKTTLNLMDLAVAESSSLEDVSNQLSEEVRSGVPRELPPMLLCSE